MAAAARSLSTFLACRGRVSGPRRHFSGYVAQWRYRLPEEAYVPGESAQDYVFFASRLWAKEPETNQQRANFVRACRSIQGLTTEGGFVPRRTRDVPGFDDVTVGRTYSLREYLDRVQRSCVAFNTPAVAGCHGWKLAEFLALGKAIISTPISRALPATLEHRVHVHLVDGSVRSIVDALKEIRSDEAYRRHLEYNARSYYREYLSPEKVIEKILGIARGLIESGIAPMRSDV